MILYMLILWVQTLVIALATAAGVIASVVVGAYVIKLIVQCINRRDDPRHRRPANDACPDFADHSVHRVLRRVDEARSEKNAGEKGGMSFFAP